MCSIRHHPYRRLHSACIRAASDNCRLVRQPRLIRGGTDPWRVWRQLSRYSICIIAGWAFNVTRSNKTWSAQTSLQNEYRRCHCITTRPTCLTCFRSRSVLAFCHRICRSQYRRKRALDRVRWSEWRRYHRVDTHRRHMWPVWNCSLRARRDTALVALDVDGVYEEHSAVCRQCRQRTPFTELRRVTIPLLSDIECNKRLLQQRRLTMRPSGNNHLEATYNCATLWCPNTLLEWNIVR